jgi:hypothetical protein
MPALSVFDLISPKVTRSWFGATFFADSIALVDVT